MPAKRHRRDPTGLTEREKRFIAEYVRDLNGRQAAIRTATRKLVPPPTRA